MKGFLAPLQGLAEYEQICEKSKKIKGSFRFQDVWNLRKPI